MKVKRKHRFIVGYTGDRQVAYGKDVNRQSSWCEPLTIFDAKRKLKSLYPTRGAEAIIFELVPTKIKFTFQDRKKAKKI